MRYEKFSLLRWAALFGAGAVGYCLLEILWRGHTHWTMGLAGGICLVGLRALHMRLAHRPLALQALAGAALVTAVEFVTGCVVNLLLGWQVWDYSAWHVQLLGQVCLVFCMLWYVLAFGVMGAFHLAERRKS